MTRKSDTSFFCSYSCFLMILYVILCACLLRFAPLQIHNEVIAVESAEIADLFRLSHHDTDPDMFLFFRIR